MKLSNFCNSKDNNFNLIRVVAALGVLITHSFALSTGSSMAEPLRESLGVTMGSIAVDVFFITSGFLVTASLFTRQSAIEFIWARFLRIYPAMLVMLVLTVFGLGIAFTSVPTTSYLTDSLTYTYLLKCSTLIAGVAYMLPGVFQDNPYKGAVNGSLWTLPYELHMYAILVTVWFVLRMAKLARVRIFKVTIVAAASISGALVLIRYPDVPVEGSFTKLFFMFFSGAAFYVLRERITLSRLAFWVLATVLAISTVVNKQVFFVVYTLALSYLLFYLAYVPTGPIRKYNKLGDYSYGLYIYAFPVQQSVAALIPGVSVLSMVVISAVVTFTLAAISWHVIERRSLGLKGIYVGHTKKILAYRTAGKSPQLP
jgi:peptidoglycan/LPS O-acetylase OafA/YrhL